MTTAIKPRVRVTLTKPAITDDLFAEPAQPPLMYLPLAQRTPCDVCGIRGVVHAQCASDADDAPIALLCEPCAADLPSTLAHVETLLAGLQRQIDTAQERYQALYEAAGIPNDVGAHLLALRYQAGPTTLNRYEQVREARKTMDPATFARRLQLTLAKGDDLAQLLTVEQVLEAEQAARDTQQLWPRQRQLWTVRFALGWQEQTEATRDAVEVEG